MSASKAAAATLLQPNAGASPRDADSGWEVVIVYDDASAGKHAIHTLEGVTRRLSGSIPLLPSLWRFDLLEDPDWRAAATAEAIQAGLIVISTSSEGDLPAAVRDWVHGCLQSGTEAPGALVALLGRPGAAETSDSPQIQFLRNEAQAAGIGFFAPSPAVAASPTPARPAHRILLLEDDSAILRFSTLVLVRAGYQVNAVEGSQAAWEAIQSASYDLLVTDNKMPGMSGLELVSKLRSAHIGLPIIVASGGIEAEEFAQNQSLQPAIPLPKPFSAKQLLETVAEALRRAGGGPAHIEVSYSTSRDAYDHWGLNE